MKPDHAYNPTCPCRFCGVTAWHLSGSVLKPATAKVSAPLVLISKPLGEVIFVDFKNRKRV